MVVWVRDGVMCEMVGCAVAWWVVVEGVTSGNGGGECVVVGARW